MVWVSGRWNPPHLDGDNRCVMCDYPKSIKKLLQHFRREAYERALRRELTKLDHSFAAWRAGRLSNGELNQRIHQYETGAARELYKQYHHNPPDLSVAYALVVGILQRDEVPAELLAALEGPLRFYQSLQERNELKEPE